MSSEGFDVMDAVLRRVVAAPMAGGVNTEEFLAATLKARALPFLAAGYLDVEAFTAQAVSLRARAGDQPWGVNLFVPGQSPVPVDPGVVLSYAETLEPWAAERGSTLGPARFDDDDHYAQKLSVVLELKPSVVSFTFGLPGYKDVQALHAEGILVWATVTNQPELQAAQSLGVDAAVLQHTHAGGHSGAFMPLDSVAEAAAYARSFPSVESLVAALAPTTALPLIAAGGISSPSRARAALEAGAAAVQLGTVLLRTDESGAKPAHKSALVDPEFTETVITKAFTGREARALSNDFTRTFTASAPWGYPALHHVTGPLRAAAGKAGDTNSMHLWAGTSHASSPAGPLTEVLTDFVNALESMT